MRKAAIFAVIVALVASFPAGGNGDDWERAQDHPWGSFEVGSWKRVKVTHETFERSAEKPVLVTSAETKTTLSSKSRRDYVLSVHSQITMPAQGRPQQAQVRRRFRRFGRARRVGRETIRIHGQLFPSEIREEVLDLGHQRQVNTLKISSQTSPQVLSRSTVATDPSGKNVHYVTHVDVTDIQSKSKVLGEIVDTWNVKTVHREGSLTTTTWETHSDQVPGTLVSRLTEVRDMDSGDLVRRTKLELIGYGRPSRARSRTP